MTSKYDQDVCPFCELPFAKEEQDAEWERRSESGGDPDLKAWEDQYCWSAWDHQGVSIEERLIEVLEQRDAARAEIADFQAAGMPTDHAAGVEWIKRLIQKCDEVDVLRAENARWAYWAEYGNWPEDDDIMLDAAGG